MKYCKKCSTKNKINKVFIYQKIGQFLPQKNTSKNIIFVRENKAFEGYQKGKKR